MTTFKPQSLEDDLSDIVKRFSNKPDTTNIREQIHPEINRVNRQYGVTAIWDKTINTIHVTMDSHHSGFTHISVEYDMAGKVQSIEPVKVCCGPKDLKWYDSGFSRFQYCVKCNKEIK